MKHLVHHKGNVVPVRWRLVIKTVLVVFALFVVAGVMWYVVAVVVPQRQNARLIQTFDELQLHSLQNRMLRVETVLHLH